MPENRLSEYQGSENKALFSMLMTMDYKFTFIRKHICYNKPKLKQNYMPKDRIFNTYPHSTYQRRYREREREPVPLQVLVFSWLSWW